MTDRGDYRRLSFEGDGALGIIPTSETLLCDCKSVCTRTCELSAFPSQSLGSASGTLPLQERVCTRTYEWLSKLRSLFGSLI